MCVCVCTCVCVCVCTYVCVYRAQANLVSHALGATHLVVWNSLRRLRRLKLGFQAHAIMPGFFHVFWGIRLRSSCCKTNTSLIQLYITCPIIFWNVDSDLDCLSCTSGRPIVSDFPVLSIAYLLLLIFHPFVSKRSTLDIHPYMSHNICSCSQQLSCSPLSSQL